MKKLITDSSEITVKKDINYPCLMKRKNTSNVVLFTDKGRGTIVHSGDTNSVGFYASNWNMDLFEEYKGRITLSFE